ncbi:MAG TPA: hypothetical protein VFQ26_03715 [Nitrospiraceae bacterium]|nr:hypothetical protein [Nitrospiraceae bacterium]
MRTQWWLTFNLLLVCASGLAHEGCLTKLGRRCGYGVGPGYHARCGCESSMVMTYYPGDPNWAGGVPSPTIAPVPEVLPNQPPPSPPMQAPLQSTQPTQQWAPPPPDVSAQARMPMRQVSASPYAWPAPPRQEPPVQFWRPPVAPPMQYVPQAQALPQYLIVPQASRTVTYQPIYQNQFGGSGW